MPKLDPIKFDRPALLALELACGDPPRKLLSMNLKRRKILALFARPAAGFWAARLKNPVFIIGCSRSGTTLLSRLMSTHRDVSEWSEANDVWDPISVRRDEDGRPLHFWDDTDGYIRHWRVGMASRRREIRAIFGIYQSIMGRPVFVNKSPINTFRVPDILDIFPDARIVHMVRDGRAVSVSYAYKLAQKMREHPDQYEGTDLSQPFDQMVVRLAAFWKANLDEVARQDQAHRLTERGIILELTYEELCDDRTAALGRLCRFAGLDPQRFGPKLALEPVVSRNDKWRKDIDSALLEQMAAQMQPTLSQRGYI